MKTRTIFLAILWGSLLLSCNEEEDTNVDSENKIIKAGQYDSTMIVLSNIIDIDTNYSCDYFYGSEKITIENSSFDLDFFDSSYESQEDSCKCNTTGNITCSYAIYNSFFGTKISTSNNLQFLSTKFEDPCIFLDKTLCKTKFINYLDTLNLNDEISSNSSSWLSDTLLYLTNEGIQLPDVGYGYWENVNGIKYLAFRYRKNNSWNYGWLEVERDGKFYLFKRIAYQQ